MVDESVSKVRRAIDLFKSVRSDLNRHLHAASADDVIQAVIKGSLPREGDLESGKYYVHGTGYTIILPTGLEIDIEADVKGDTVSIYSIQRFLEEGSVEYTVQELWLALDFLCLEGELTRIDGNKYLLAKKSPS